ncbi:ABC transporter permease [Pyxidicoccus parkwayensis]|uniref:ABC transporter permease n=1 Tax=Pyxidicoccus parkwayensis TaxID=2813578 RepID=A0ABX7P8F9_9BACT|nr:ABC transporter permease [Pyxidicoccus parkwaysis]QSQ26779.1 ABC transporter permease [Pyxidicoccus parkwaysis]
MDTVGQDLLQAFRKLRKSPGFLCVAVLTLSLGLGANTAIFSVVNAVLLRALPMADADALVRVFHEASRGDTMPSSGVDYLDMQAQNHSFSGMTGVDGTDISLTGPEGAPERLQGAQVTAGFFHVMGVQPLLGRGFQADEDQPGKSKVVVLGHSLWKRRYGGDAGIVGRTLTVNGEPYTVVGVARPGFVFPDQAQLWIPLTWEGSNIDPTNRGAHFLSAYGRLKPGVTLEQAGADLLALSKRLQEQFPQYNTGVTTHLKPLHEELVGNVEPALLMLLGAVGVVLLIACANLSNLLLARSVSREGEISVRLALGASRGRIIRQLLMESLVLALLGAGGGLLLAAWGLDLLVALGPRDIPRLAEVSLDGGVLAFTFILGLATSFLFGLVPALQTSRVELQRVLRESGKGGGGRGHRTRHLLIVTETALAVVLLVGAGLLMKSFLRLQQVDPGFKADHVLALDLALPESTYPWASPAVQTFYDTLLERVRGLPGVKQAGAAFQLPLAGGSVDSTIRDLSRPPPEPGHEDIAEVRVITPGVLETLRIPLVRGRLFTDRDGMEKGSRVVLVNEEAARRLWPGEDPIGRTVEIGANFGNGLLGGQVVGVVGSVRHDGIAKEPSPEVYAPFPEARPNMMRLVVLTEGEPLSLASRVRDEVHALDRDVPVANVRDMEAVVSNAVAQPRFYMLLVGVFAGVALLLAALGIYGVVTHAVTHRTRELGIRMALGADRQQVVGLVLSQYVRLTGTGLMLGVGLAFVASRMLGSLLYGVERTDPLTYVGVVAVLGGVAILASLLPAYRATRIDPIIALRHE